MNLWEKRRKFFDNLATIYKDEAARSQEDWDLFFIGLCNYTATKSKDRSTKLGSVIVGQNNEVLSIGFNGFPRGVDDNKEKFHLRPTKYLVTEHAERNAIFNAARHGTRLEGSKLYIPFDPTPCSRCSRGIIQSGISEIIGTQIKFTGKGKDWEEDLKIADEMLRDVNMKRRVVIVEDELDIRILNGV